MRNMLGAAVLTLAIVSVGSAQSKPRAVVNGETITEDQLNKAAAADMESLDARRIQAELGFKREQQTIYEKTLAALVADKLIEAEAKKRGITPQVLVANEVDSKVTYVSDEEVATFFETNKSRINIPPGAEANRQIRAYLMEQRRENAYQALVTKLKQDYKTETFLDHLRIDVPTQGFPTKGAATAPVTIVEFSDFECPFCAGLYPTLKQIEKNYGDKIRVVFRQFPLTQIHPFAQKAAEASLCANEQSKFWELHDAMFQDNKHLDVEALKLKASTAKLDTQAFNACLDSSKYADAIKKDIVDGVKAGVTGTPAMFINGRFVNGNVPYAEVSKLIEEELQKKN